MPFDRYVRREDRAAPRVRTWPTRSIQHAPLWSSVDLRDGNQALPNPMDPQRKGMMFDLLVQIGFKDIEVGYPSSSQADFDFVRGLIDDDRIPDDVTIGVFTPAKPELIDRTFEAIRGADRAVVHLCNATACLWRDVVFGMTPAQVRQMADTSARHMMRRADDYRGTQVHFEYSPETFNVTEPDFALEVSNSVATILEASPDRPLILNLPTTVETDSPNVFADQVEWMDRHLNNRESIILSVHPHNDRGTAVAAAELALMSGADRIEGTLFGNGERTGNVCLATLALNLFTRGIDPQLDFADIDDVRNTVEFCNQMPVHMRHPYVGELVYTAFSGTHQDAIAKGMNALQRNADDAGLDIRSIPWDVPYLPIDPKDVGRDYESIVRLNSQSGKGGIAHVLKSHYGLDLPALLRRQFAAVVQRTVDSSGVELDHTRLWDVFATEYLELDSPIAPEEFAMQQRNGQISVTVRVTRDDGGTFEVTGTGADAASAFVDGIAVAGYVLEVGDVTAHPVNDRHVAYAELIVAGDAIFGVGIDDSPAAATISALISAVNRSGVVPAGTVDTAAAR